MGEKWKITKDPYRDNEYHAEKDDGKGVSEPETLIDFVIAWCVMGVLFGLPALVWWWCKKMADADKKN